MKIKGKTNASRVTRGDRIVVKVYDNSIFPSAARGGKGATVTRVIGKQKTMGRRGYIVQTGIGEFYAQPIQTMWLAPEDQAGRERAYAEALAEDIKRAVARRGLMFRVEFARIGRYQDVPDLQIVIPEDDPRSIYPLLSNSIHQYVGRFLASYEYEVDLDVVRETVTISGGRLGRGHFYRV